jgi:CHAT domain-containing protein
MGWPLLKSYLEQVDQIYIIPDDFLAQVPFSTLLMDTTSSSKFLIQEAAIQYIACNSFVSLDNNKKFQTNFLGNKVLISADKSIKGVQNIVNLVRKALPNNQLLTDYDGCSKDELLENLLENYDIYIILGHGISNINYPELSKLEFNILVAETNNSVTIPVSIADLKRGNWSDAKLIILVGCETGKGKVYRGTGMVGVQHAFLGLGADDVIGTLWEIDAAQYLTQVDDFINFMVKNPNPVLALQYCKIRSIERLKVDKYFRNPFPYFWGSFTLHTNYN